MRRSALPRASWLAAPLRLALAVALLAALALALVARDASPAAAATTVLQATGAGLPAPVTAPGPAPASRLRIQSAEGAYAWGYNYYGQVGDGSTTNRSAPVAVSGLSGVTALAAGSSHSLALLSDGTVRAWGATTPASSATARGRTAPRRWR